MGKKAAVASGPKVAIVGFTQSRTLAPYADGDWEIWGLNDLYLDMPVLQDVQRLRWFQVHKWVEVVHHKPVRADADPLDFRAGPPHPRDANHVAWLQTMATKIPIYLLEPRPEVPEARIIDREAIYRYFSNDGVKRNTYFTNTISWQLAMAIMEMVPEPGGRCLPGSELGVWGVDMMMAGGTGSEYGYQRPSCEWLLGWARGAGITVHVPDESDLLKTAFVYGDHGANAYRVKLMDHRKELQRRLGEQRQVLAQAQGGIAELSGALNILDWQLKSWMPGEGEDEWSKQGGVPMPDAHKQAPVLGQPVDTE